MLIEDFKLKHIEMFIRSWIGSCSDIDIFGIEFSEPMFEKDEEGNVTENVQYIFVKYTDKENIIHQTVMVWDIDDDEFFDSKDIDESNSEDKKFKEKILFS